MKRLQSVDIVRGIVMIIMALDHTRDLMHITSVADSPTNLETTTPALFFTRWITHFCAPTFVFLSGVSAYLVFKKTNNVTDPRRFLLTRGLWLVVLEFTLVNFGIWFDPHFTVFIFDVIATIGFGFIILSLFLKSSTKTILIIGLAIIFLHNLSAFIP
ncbi:MAG TPA: heparan-alpha-glucosaminide N-acetyltransferase domain-containing protein, partial [Segetibacter sp.]|nr:heparan-alpha-glucosaminide N-acetyltransferase domain-containing protein [Segetibacter sp.]